MKNLKEDVVDTLNNWGDSITENFEAASESVLAFDRKVEKAADAAGKDVAMFAADATNEVNIHVKKVATGINDLKSKVENTVNHVTDKVDKLWEGVKTFFISICIIVGTAIIFGILSYFWPVIKCGFKCCTRCCRICQPREPTPLRSYRVASYHQRHPAQSPLRHTGRNP